MNLKNLQERNDMIWNKQNKLKRVAEDLLKTMTAEEAMHFCFFKEIEVKKEAEEMARRHTEEYLEVRKRQDEWMRISDIINNTKQKPL